MSAPVARQDEWRVVLKRRHIGQLHTFGVDPRETGRVIMEGLHDQFGLSKSQEYFNKVFLCREEALFTGIVSLSSIGALESQAHGSPVGVTEMVFDSFLTSAYHNPESLAAWTDFGESNFRFSRRALAAAPCTPPKAIIIAWKSTKAYIAWLLLLASLLSLAAGLIVGLLQHDAALGIAATSGVAAVLSTVEVLFLWRLR